MKLLVALALAALALAPVTSALAAQPIEIQGEHHLSSVDSGTCTPIGSSGHSLLVFTGTEVYTGTLSGSGTITYRIVRLGPCDIDLGSARESVHTVMHFTGTVLGREGSFDIVNHAQIDGDFLGTGGGVIINGTGELAGIHGVYREVGRLCDGCSPHYTGQIILAP